MMTNFMGGLGGCWIFGEAVDGAEDAERLAPSIQDVVEVDGRDAEHLGRLCLRPALAPEGVPGGLDRGGTFLVCGLGHLGVNVCFALTI